MKPIYVHLSAGLALTFTIGACVPRAPAPTPRPAPSPIVTPPPPTVTQPVYDNWMDAPQTPGDWTYRPEQGGGVATFGEPRSEPRFVMRCDRSQGLIHLDRTGNASSEVSMLLRTETADRTLRAQAGASSLPRVSAAVTARDPLLDAMAFSKGRFAVAVDGLPTLYLPAWPEVTRVIEDCR